MIHWKLLCSNSQDIYSLILMSDIQRIIAVINYYAKIIIFFLHLSLTWDFETRSSENAIARGRFTYFTDWRMRWDEVRRVNNHRDPSSRSNFAPGRVSKGNDWRSTLRCSINWRITFLRRSVSSAHNEIVLYVYRSWVPFDAPHRRRGEKENGRKGRTAAEWATTKSEKNVNGLENERGMKRAD